MVSKPLTRPAKKSLATEKATDEDVRRLMKFG